MHQIALQLDRPNPANLLARLDLAASAAGITQLSFRRGQGGMSPAQETGRIGKLLRQARAELAEYFAGDRTFFSVPVDLSRVPAFERAALEVAARIPYGEVRSYKWIAERLGNPDTARAVGGAMAGNPVPIIVPCHRVVKTDGGLGGYSFGLMRKEALLNLERSTTPYVGCASTRVFCRRGCMHERQIHPGGRIHFASGADARTSGYRPCSVCQPA
ncbi:MAG TPA: methylated-DNA--[protein]-cysteine S-methyltransferase [Candidatus Methylomirabilis sp.]|nr:methylated-DNA--[protein]-cysteine S-methyltransferase [Candidatus Methylomirabilis sp.]